MKTVNFLGTIALASAAIFATDALAQNSTRNIGPAPNNIGPGQPCMPGYTCINPPAPPPPPNFRVAPPCYPPNTLMQIRTLFGTRYECRAPVYVQPLPQPIPVPQPIQQPIQQPQGLGQGQHSQAHYAYCANKYKSYRPATNSYTAYSGQTKYCNSPYN